MKYTILYTYIISRILLLLCNQGYAQNGSWQYIGLPNKKITAIAFDFQNDSILYVGSYSDFSAGTYGSIFKSNDGGMSWDTLVYGVSVNKLEINPANSQELFLGSRGNFPEANLIFRSSNGGEDWYGFSNGLPDSGHMSSIEIDSQYKRIYIGVNAFNATGIYIYDGLTSIDHRPPEMPASFFLHQNYPNPFNPSTTIRFSLAVNQRVKLTIYSVTGEKIATLTDGFMESGEHQIEWQGTNQAGIPVASGIYFYELQTNNQRLVKKMLLTR